MTDENNIEIDPELWLQILMNLTTNEQDRQALIEHLSQKSGLSPEKTDEFLYYLKVALFDLSRSN